MSVPEIKYEELPKCRGNERVYITEYQRQYRRNPEKHEKLLDSLKTYYYDNREKILRQKREAYQRKKERLNMVGVN